MKKETAPWVRKAEGDFKVAQKLHRDRPAYHDAVCFHSQQAIEKYAKALLVELSLPVPKTHDLGRLRSLLEPHDATLRPFRRGMLFVTTFAVETRYPGENATKRDAASALRWAERIRLEVRRRLGLRTTT